MLLLRLAFLSISHTFMKFSEQRPPVFFFWHFERKASVFLRKIFLSLAFISLFWLASDGQKKAFPTFESFNALRNQIKKIANVRNKFTRAEDYCCSWWGFSSEQILNSLICLDHLIYFCQLRWLCRCLILQYVHKCVRVLYTRIKIGNDHCIWHRHNYQLLIIFCFFFARFHTMLREVTSRQSSRLLFQRHFLMIAFLCLIPPRKPFHQFN